MQTKPTIPGKWYAVTSASGCKVTFETNGGTVTLDMQAPQDVFCAVSGKATVSDDAADVRQTFNLAPSFFKAARGWGQDPIWFKSLHAVLTRLLDGTQFEMVLTEQGSKLIVHTDRVADDLLEQVRTTAEAYLPAGVELVQYNHHIEVSWRDINKYAECVTVSDIRAVNPDYKKDYTSDGGWIWPLDSLKNAEGLFRDYKDKNLRYIHFYAPELTAANRAFSDINRETPYPSDELIAYMPKCMLGRRLAVCGPFIRKIKITINPETTSLDYEFTRNDVLEDFEINELPKLSYIGNGFDGTRLNKNSILRLLNQLPTWTSGTHPATIGIHIDHQNDEEVLSAIANAEAKGWTLIVQWNGTPTAQAATTYGLRKPPIYARVSEIERPDGTTERYLDWGHYVTDPTGYEEFRSVEAAREYYGLPEETLTETE